MLRTCVAGRTLRGANAKHYKCSSYKPVGGFTRFYADIAEELGDLDIRDLIAIYERQLRAANKRRKR
jgi:hypothetical protein